MGNVRWRVKTHAEQRRRRPSRPHCDRSASSSCASLWGVLRWSAAQRTQTGASLPLLVDANVGYTMPQLVDFLQRTRALDLQLIEQPLPPAASAAQATLPGHDLGRLVADESLHDRDDAAAPARAGGRGWVSGEGSWLHSGVGSGWSGTQLGLLMRTSAVGSRSDGFSMRRGPTGGSSPTHASGPSVVG